MPDSPPAQRPASALRGRLLPMRGRDPGEQHRVASNLELIFDLTFAGPSAACRGAGQ